MQVVKCLVPEASKATHVKVIILSAILVRQRGHSEQASEQGLHTEKEKPTRLVRMKCYLKAIHQRNRQLLTAEVPARKQYCSSCRFKAYFADM